MRESSVFQEYFTTDQQPLSNPNKKSTSILKLRNQLRIKPHLNINEISDHSDTRLSRLSQTLTKTPHGLPALFRDDVESNGGSLSDRSAHNSSKRIIPNKGAVTERTIQNYDLGIEIYQRRASQNSQMNSPIVLPRQNNSFLDTKKKSATSPTVKTQRTISQRKVPFGLYERNLSINRELQRKWMGDQKAFQTMESFHQALVQFIKLAPKNAMQKIFKLIQFNTCLKPLFLSNQTSIQSSTAEVDFDTLCSKAFNMNIYDQYLRERFTINQINSYRKLSKQMKKANYDEYQQLQKQLVALKVPSFTQFVNDILLNDIRQLTQKLNDLCTKKYVDGIQILGDELQDQKQKVSDLQYRTLKKLQNKRNYNPVDLAMVKRLQIGNGLSFQGISTQSLLYNLDKMEINYGQMHLISSTQRHIYHEIQKVLLKLKTSTIDT